MTPFRQRILDHPGLAWLALCVLGALALEVTGLEFLDGGAGSLLTGLLFLFAAHFLIVGRIAVALTSWAPFWVQVVTVAVCLIGLALVLDRPLASLIRRFVQRISSL